MNSVFSHDAFFSFCCIISSTNNCTSVSHCSSFWSSFTCNKTNNWFTISVSFYPTSSIRF